MYVALPVIVTVPNEVQLLPFVERDAVMVLPERTSRTQYGATNPLLVVIVVLPPVLLRHCHVNPLLGVRATNAFWAFAARLWRIMTPARAAV